MESEFLTAVKDNFWIVVVVVAVVTTFICRMGLIHYKDESDEDSGNDMGEDTDRKAKLKSEPKRKGDQLLKPVSLS